MKRKAKVGLLSECRAKLVPLEHVQEGKLRGGFGGISGAAALRDFNGGCVNDKCTNNPCPNVDCVNVLCVNGGCSNTPTPTSTPSASPTPTYTV